MARVNKNAAPRAASPPYHGAVSVRILVIDDDNDDVELIDRILMDHGYVSLLARDGDEALRIASLQEPDLVLLDLRMPRIDGYEVATTIRTRLGLDRTRIVAVTGMEEDRERAAAAGFDGFIRKPIDPETFVPQIQDFLAGSA
jgi:CheY-like chemotaxis protein